MTNYKERNIKKKEITLSIVFKCISVQNGTSVCIAEKNNFLKKKYDSIIEKSLFNNKSNRFLINESLILGSVYKGDFKVINDEVLFDSIDNIRVIYNETIYSQEQLFFLRCLKNRGNQAVLNNEYSFSTEGDSIFTSFKEIKSHNRVRLVSEKIKNNIYYAVYSFSRDEVKMRFDNSITFDIFKLKSDNKKNQFLKYCKEKYSQFDFIDQSSIKLSEDKNSISVDMNKEWFNMYKGIGEFSHVLYYYAGEEE